MMKYYICQFSGFGHQSEKFNQLVPVLDALSHPVTYLLSCTLMIQITDGIIKDTPL